MCQPWAWRQGVTDVVSSCDATIMPRACITFHCGVISITRRRMNEGSFIESADVDARGTCARVDSLWWGSVLLTVLNFCCVVLEPSGSLLWLYHWFVFALLPTPLPLLSTCLVVPAASQFMRLYHVCTQCDMYGSPVARRIPCLLLAVHAVVWNWHEEDMRRLKKCIIPHVHVTCSATVLTREQAMATEGISRMR
jgi:hypothetical protein